MLILTATETEPADDPTRHPCDDTVPPPGGWTPAALDRLLTALDLHCDHADRRAS